MSAQTPTLRPELPPLPAHMRSLPVDSRGYPVPWFVSWLDEDENEVEAPEGRPEFRLMSGRKLNRAVKEDRCWVCGDRLGRFRAFTIGPMCLLNRVNAEPPSHADCADWSARACPFLSRPHMTRREAGLPEKADKSNMAGVPIMRNPGCAVVYISDKRARILREPGKGPMFMLPPLTDLRCYAQGRRATYSEVEQAIESGLPALLEVCTNDEERGEVYARRDSALAVVAALPD